MQAMLLHISPAAKKKVIPVSSEHAATHDNPQPVLPAKIGWASRAVIGILRLMQSKPVEIVLFVPTYRYVMAAY